MLSDIFEFAAGLTLVAIVLRDAFETVILPRTVRHRYRLAPIIVLGGWSALTALSHLPRVGGALSGLLSTYGSLSLITLIVTWAVGLIVGFALMLLGLDNPMPSSLGHSVYLSGTTFFTLGLGDFAPVNTSGRALVVLEAGIGFGFLAMVIGYLPIFYQAFSRREVAISLLDARAGSPPTAIAFLSRNGERVSELLTEWERWSAELLESHLSYPILAFFRSQHDKQSWLSALVVILDTCALIMAGLRDVPEKQASFTFAVARHALIDLSQIFFVSPEEEPADRLDAEEFVLLARLVNAAGHGFREVDTEHRLAEIRSQYEPLAVALSRLFLLDLPPWLPDANQLDNWQSTPWGILADHE